ncbi:hypothetical protein OSB04_015047 [Centaurea solstitialis]|uniref:Diacylglycerol O-acyltransferase n=1 Tax=Centaurea solstitialis TaxID=347529 RepID=A0AA38W721_9ASTR|nr:hypothetical protein OSB04_015047 [Centaurea solstitialis]
MMRKTTSLKPLRLIKATQDHKEGFDEVEDDEQPLSPGARLFHEPGANVYIIIILGMKTQINTDVFKANIPDSICKNHRFSSLQVLDKENGKMKWVPTHVELDNHVIVPKFDPDTESGDKFVEDYISNLSKSHIDNSKPLWDLHILNTKTLNAQGTCIFRIHHSIGDGMSLVNLLLACSRKASDPEALPTLPGDNKLGRKIKLVTSFRYLFMVIWNAIVALVVFILTVLFPKDTKTLLSGYPGIEDRPRRFVFTSVSFDDIKLVKKAMDVKVNDVVLGVIKAGLYRYLNRRYGAKENNNNHVPENTRLRATLFFNMRPSTMIEVRVASTLESYMAFNTDATRRPGAWGNKVSYVLLSFDMKHKQDLLDYVREVKTDMERKKASLEPLYTAIIINLVIKLFGVKFAGKLNHKVFSNTTVALSNVPGPQEHISLYGHQVNYIASSCYGQPMALMISVVSYVDKMTFVVSADEEIIPDPQSLCHELQASLQLMKSSISNV